MLIFFTAFTTYRCPDVSRMSSSEEEYGRAERSLPKSSHSAQSLGKNKYSESSGRVSESSGVSNRYLDSTGARTSFQESSYSSSRYNDNGGNSAYSHNCDSNRYSASENESNSPRYNDQTSSRFSEVAETIMRYPAESRTETCRGSRYIESGNNSYHENPIKGSRFSDGRMSNDGERYQSEAGSKFSNSTSERYLIPPPEATVEKYAKNDIYLHHDKPEITPERNVRCMAGIPGRLERSGDRSNERYYSERGSERSERNHERSEKHSDRISEKYVSGNDKYILHNSQDSNSRGSDRYGSTERNPDRYSVPERKSDRFSDEYIQSSERISNSDQFIESADGYRSNDRDGYRSDRYLFSSGMGEVQRFDRYCTLPSHSDKYNRKSTDRFESSRYLPPPAPAPSERYHPPERYIPPPAPSNDRFNETIRERYLETPSKDRYQDRYIPPPAPERFVTATYDRFHSTTINPGDPYMRRDLGYHHHYRLPHPNYHVHQQSAYYHSHYQRTLPNRSLGTYHPHHSILPSPSRAQLRCCPSSSHYVQSEDHNSSSSSSSHSSNVLTANITGPSLPVLAASLTNGQNLTSFSASVNVNIVAAQGTSTASRERDREYLPSCPSPLLTNRGRPPSVNTTRISPALVDNVGANSNRHGSTPTPPPSIPRCSSLSSCEINGDSNLCKIDHSHHHYTPARRSCSGAMEQGTSLTLSCTSSRRSVNSPTLNLSNAISTNQPTTVLNHSAGTFSDNIPKVPSAGSLSSSAILEPSRQGVAVSCILTASSNSQTHSTMW